MNVESERLKLRIASIQAVPGGRLSVRRTDGVEILVPSEHREWLRMVADGQSLYQMALGVRESPVQGRFASLARFLGFLAYSGLLADDKVIRFAEALQPDHRWRESIAFEELASLELFRLPSGRVGSFTALLFTLMSFVVALTCLAAFLKPAASMEFEWGQVETALPIFGAFLYSFSVGRSVKAIFQALALRFTAGYGASLGIRVDPVSLSVGTDGYSEARSTGLSLLAGALVTCSLMSPVLIAQVFPKLKAIESYIWIFTLLLVLVEMSPFTKSSLTEWLRAFYALMERRGSRSTGRGADAPERRLQTIHRMMSVSWIALFDLFVLGLGYLLVMRIRPNIDFTSGAGLLGTALLVLSQGLILAASVDDIVNGLTLRGAGDTGRIRRIWKRTRPQLPVDEAIQLGKIPDRADLENLPLIRQTDPSTRAELLSRAQVLDLDEGEAACRQDQADRSLFILLSGKLAVAKRIGSSRRRVVALLDPGSVFGEAAFFFAQRRTADVVAMEPSRLLKIPHDETMKTVDSGRTEELQLRIWLLQALVSGPLFRELPSEALDALVMAGIKKTYRPGEKIISEGERADACYVIVQGQATVVQNMAPINRMRAGDVFGEIALLNPSSLRTATVVADSGLITVKIDADRFWNLLASHIPLAIEFERVADLRLSQDRHRRQSKSA